MKYIIYKTTNLINNKTYIGIHQTEDLDDGYLGSGLAMKRAIKKYGKQNFSREILEFCLSYDELIEKEKTYVNEEWISLEDNYNLKTGGQSSGLLSEESKTKISNSLKDYYKENDHPFKGEKRIGYIPPNKGKKLEDLYDSEKVKEIKEKASNANKGKNPWNKGIETGQIPWNKGKKGLQEGWCKGLKLQSKTDEEKEAQSKKLIEYYKENEHPTKGLEPWNKGVTMNKIECPHCNKMVDIGNGKRWHFDNCKLKLC
jgi:hypothetical protein